MYIITPILNPHYVIVLITLRVYKASLVPPRVQFFTVDCSLVNAKFTLWQCDFVVGFRPNESCQRDRHNEPDFLGAYLLRLPFKFDFWHLVNFEIR